MRQVGDDAIPYDFAIPELVYGAIDIRKRRQYSHPVSRNLKRDLQRIKRNSLVSRVTCDRDSLDDFSQHVRAHVRERFGKSAFFASFDEVLRAFPMCELLIVQRDGRAIAGALLNYSLPNPDLWMTGLRQPIQEQLKCGTRHRVVSISPASELLKPEVAGWGSGTRDRC